MGRISFSYLLRSFAVNSLSSLYFCPHLSVKRMDGDSPRENAKSAKERFCPLRSSAVHFLRGGGKGTTKGTKGHEKAGGGGRQKNKGTEKWKTGR